MGGLIDGMSHFSPLGRCASLELGWVSGLVDGWMGGSMDIDG